MQAEMTLEELIRAYFDSWIKKDIKVLEATFAKISSTLNTMVRNIAEWYFRYRYDGKEGESDGVSIIKFDHNGKIMKLCEYKSESHHYFQFG